MSRYYIALERVEKAVIAVRVSGGHLCEAEAPTEPAGETAVRCVAIRFSFNVNTDSFTFRVQNDKPFSYCEYLWRADKHSLTCHCEAA